MALQLRLPENVGRRGNTKILQIIRRQLERVCATHRSFLGVAGGRFREDLYCRIAVLNVELPPLRERLEDLPEISAKILARLARSAQRNPPRLSQDALPSLSAHPIPGNVRELQNVLTRAFVLATGPKIQAADVDLGSARAAGGFAPYHAQARIRVKGMTSFWK